MTTILNNPTQYPLIDVASESITIQPTTTSSNFVARDDVRGGFGVNPFAPEDLVDNMMTPVNGTPETWFNKAETYEHVTCQSIAFWYRG